MAFSKTELKYYLTNFRTRKSYFIFQLFLLSLSLIIVASALLSDNIFREPFVLWLEFMLLVLMMIDLFVIRLISEGAIWNTKTNKIDCIILIVFSITFVFLCFTENEVKENSQNGYEILLDADDIILIAIIVIRYGVQIWQMIKTIKNTRKNIEIQRNMKDIDLNKTPNMSAIDDIDGGFHHDEMIKEKIKANTNKNINAS